MPPSTHISDYDDVLLPLRNGHPHTLKRYLSVVPREVVFACQINGNPIKDSETNGVIAFQFDNDTGDLEDILPNMTIEFGTLPGSNDLGYHRVHSTHPVIDNTIYIGEIDPKRLNIVDNTYATVIRHFAPHTKPPRIERTNNGVYFNNDFTEYHDYDIEHDNFNNNFAPKANACGEDERQLRYADWVIPGEDYRIVYLDGATLSQSMAGGTCTCVWDVDVMEILDGGLTQDFIVFKMAVGFQYAKLTAQCSFNGQTDYLWIPLWTHDASYPPYAVKVESDARREGRDMSFRFTGADGDLANFPKQAHCCYWEVPNFPGFEEMPQHYIHSFLGWATSEATRIRKGDRSEYTLQVGGSTTWMKEIDSYSQTMNKVDSVTKWYEMDYITVDRMILYMVREYTTFAQLINIHFSLLDTRTEVENVRKAKIWDQVKDLSAAFSGFDIKTDSSGGMWCRRHHSYLESGDRQADPTMILHPDDWTDDSIEITFEKTDPLTMVKVTGSDYSGGVSTVKNAKAPGSVGASNSGKVEEMPYQRFIPGSPDQQARRLSGHHWARLKTMELERPPSPTLVGNLDLIEPAWCEPVLIESLTDNVRGITISSRYLVKGVSVRHSEEFGQPPKTISWELEKVTLGLEGDDWVIASENGFEGGDPFFPYDLESPFSEGMAPFQNPSGTARPLSPPPCTVPMVIVGIAPGVTVEQIDSTHWRIRNSSGYHEGDDPFGHFRMYVGRIKEAYGRCFGISGATQAEANYDVLTCDGSVFTGVGGSGGGSIRENGWGVRIYDYDPNYTVGIDTTYTIGCVDED